MAHWEHRPEEAWNTFRFNHPYEKGRKKLQEEVLDKTDFDPACLWQWGTMQAMAVIQILKDCERKFGAEGQKVVNEALVKVGLDVGRQILSGITKPEGMSYAEFISFYATVLNRIAYASLEEPSIDGEDQVSFHIKWCPHQDHYKAFDCRVQRYFVQGMMEAVRTQPLVKVVHIEIDREMLAARCRGKNRGGAGDPGKEVITPHKDIGENYTTLTGDMLHVRLTVAYRGKMAVCGMKYVKELDYPLMYVDRVEDICDDECCPI